MDKSKKWLKSVKGKLGQKGQPAPEQINTRESVKSTSLPRLGKSSKAELLRACSDKDEKRVLKLLSKRVDDMTTDGYLECMRSSISPDAESKRQQVSIVDELAKHSRSAPYFNSLAIRMDNLWCHISPATINTVCGGMTDVTRTHVLKIALSYPTNATLVQAVLNNGLDPNTRFGSEPAFLRAVQSYDLDLIRAFFPGNGINSGKSSAKSLDINITNARMQTALHAAMSNYKDSASIATFLLDQGADPLIADSEGRTALHRAAQFHLTPILRRILDLGVDIATADKSGRTALHWAAERNEVANVKLLLSRGAPVGLRTTAGELPIHLAGNLGHAEAFNLLRENAGLAPVRRPTDGLLEPETRKTSDKRTPDEGSVKGSTMWPDYVIRDPKRGTKTTVTPSEALYWN